MPKLFFFLFIFSLNELYAQQKINYLKYPDGTETYHLITKRHFSYCKLPERKKRINVQTQKRVNARDLFKMA